jgi:hypothetical protein
MPACKPAVPLEDVFSQEDADFETSYLEVIGYVKLRTGSITNSAVCHRMVFDINIHQSDHAINILL